jgi:hypothetical protein
MATTETISTTKTTLTLLEPAQPVSARLAEEGVLRAGTVF